MGEKGEKKKLTRREFIHIGGGIGALLATPAGALAAGASAAGAPAAAAPAAGATAAAAAAAPAAVPIPLPQVPRRVLGKTGQKIPILLMGGAVPFDERFDPKIAEGLRFGVDYVDAADCYSGGACEPAVGAFHTRAKNRDKLWITSKSDAHDPEGFAKTLATSLEKLKTDHVDMYFLHALQDPKVFTPELEKLVAQLKKEGKIRFFGFSCHDGNVPELLTIASKTPWVDSVMFRYNFRQYGNKPLNDAMDAAHKAGVGLIAMKTQSSETSFSESWKKYEQTGKWNKFQAVLKAVWADERITAAVSHMDNFDKLKQNVAAALDGTKLTRLEEESLERYARATRGQTCDGCDHLCAPHAPVPLRIGDGLRALMYHDAYGEPERARALWARLPAASREVAGLDLSRAEAACPHGVPIARLMTRAGALLS